MYRPACLINHTGGRSTSSPRAALNKIGSLFSEAMTTCRCPRLPLLSLLVVVFLPFAVFNRVPAMDDAPCASALVVADIPRALYSASRSSKKLMRLPLSRSKKACRAFSRSDAEDKREKMMGVNDDVLDISLSGGPYRKEDFFFPSHLGFCFFRNFCRFFECILFC